MTEAGDENDLYSQAHDLKMRLQWEIQKGEAKGIGEYFYLSDDAYPIILAALAKAVETHK